MPAIADITLHEKILLAAFSLEEEGKTPFSAESLIVSAWRKYPAAFGLKEFVEQYPDSNKVLVGLMGTRGLAHRGWLVKMGKKQYALTREGRQTVRRILEGGEKKPTPIERKPRATMQLSRDHEKLLLQLLASSAYEKFREDRKGELSFADACRYWGITENLSGSDLDARFHAFRLSMTEIDRLLGGTGEAVIQGGRSVTSAEVGQLDQLHSYLETRFGRHLNLLRNRAGRN